MEGFRHSVFGSALHSNLCVPGLPVATPTTQGPEIRLHLGIAPDFDGRPATVGDTNRDDALTYVSSYTDDAGEPALRVWRTADGGLLHLVYSDGTQFWLDRAGDTIWSVWSVRSSLENAASYLLGPILGLVLRLRGVVCLHASAVAFGDRCVAFVGPEGAGKSTIAGMFARLGHAIVSDDIVGLAEREGRFSVSPAYPHVCLWPESVQMLFGSPDALPRALPDWEKRLLILGEEGTRFESRELPLVAVYVFGARRPSAGPEVVAIPDQKQLLSLVANTYATNLIDRDMRGAEFSVLSRLISSVPVRMVHSSHDPGRLDELCQVIRTDLESRNA